MRKINRKISRNVTVRLAALLASAALVATSASAHPGHGRGEGGLLHYLGEPQHVAFGLLMVAAIGLGLRAARHARLARSRIR